MFRYFLKKRGKRYCFRDLSSLFGLKEYNKPHDFRINSKIAIERCNSLINEVYTKNCNDLSIEHFDRMSKEVCDVLDPAQAVSRVSYNNMWSIEASKSFELLNPIINVINTDEKLHSKLVSFLNENSHFLEEEELRVGISFREEFERDGVHLSKEEKKNVVELKNSVLFLEETHLSKPSASNAFELIKSRQKVAEKLGFKDFSEISFQTKMMKSSEEVTDFLQNIQTLLNQPNISTKVKQTELYQSKIDFDSIIDYFIFLCKNLFEVSIERTETNSNVLEENDWLTLNVTNNDIKGRIYLNCFKKQGKLNFPVHYQVRAATMYDNEPVCVVSTGFTKTSFFQFSKNTMITVSEAGTLFHELGHAIHSLLANTKYQNFSGTRGELDFVEFPSTFFEILLFDETLLKEFGKPLLKGMISASFNRNILVEQLQRSLVDIHVHSKEFWQLNENEQKRVMNSKNYSFLNISSHLSEYGAGYYSYIVCKGIAADFYLNHFYGKTFEEQKRAGLHLKNSVLIHGGSKCPLKMRKDLLGRSNIDLKCLMNLVF